MEILSKELGPVEVSLSFAGNNLTLSVVVSEAQLLAAGVKLLPVSAQPVAEAIASVVEAGTQNL